VLHEPERVRKRSKELKELDEGRGQKLMVSAAPDPSIAVVDSSPRTPPMYWAAFVLSGDGR
jgi:hypothetical protein